jgi:CopG family transcriptional regulator / antitoxin EndoAI
MSNMKKIIVSLPESLLEQADCIVKEDEKNRSELVREALTLYLVERKKQRIRTEMMHGYKEMGMLNLRLSEEGLGEDLGDLNQYEKEL